MILIKKINIVQKNDDFSKIINTGMFCCSNCFSIYIYNNELEYNRYGITVSKKIGNSVTRNKIKRQLKNIIDINENIFKKNNDYIIIIRKGLIGLTYSEIEKNLLYLIRKDEWRKQYEKK